MLSCSVWRFIPFTQRIVVAWNQTAYPSIASCCPIAPGGRGCRVPGQSRDDMATLTDLCRELWLGSSGTLGRAALGLLQGADGQLLPTTRQPSASHVGAGGVSVLGAGVPPAGPAPHQGTVLSPSRPGRGVGRQVAEQQCFVLAQKIHVGRNKEGFTGLRSGKQCTPRSRELLLRLLLSLAQRQSITGRDGGGIPFPPSNSPVELTAMRYQKHKAKEVSKEEKKRLKGMWMRRMSLPAGQKSHSLGPLENAASGIPPTWGTSGNASNLAVCT